MANPQLTPEQRLKLSTPLFQRLAQDLERLSAGDADLLFALTRKLSKELSYFERGTPSERNRVRALKRIQQNGLCAICKLELPVSHTELDQLEAKKGYTVSNTRLVHHDCHVSSQREKGYA